MLEFQRLNRLTQEIIRHVLMMKSNQCDLNVRLFKSIFGKMAVEKLVLNGVNNLMLEEKERLLSFVLKHLESIDLKYIKKISILESSFMSDDTRIRNKNHFNKILPKKMIISGESNDKIVSTDENHSQNHKIDIYDDSKSVYSYKENQIPKIVLKAFKIYQVEKKYIDHLIWLKKYSKFLNEKYTSFYNYILDACLPTYYQKYKIQTVISDSKDTRLKGRTLN